MPDTDYLTLADWAARERISRRKAENLSHLPGFPVVKRRRTLTRTIWQKMVPAHFKAADLSRE